MNKLEEIFDKYSSIVTNVRLRKEFKDSLREAYQLGRNNTADWLVKNSKAVPNRNEWSERECRPDYESILEAKTTKDLDI